MTPLPSSTAPMMPSAFVTSSRRWVVPVVLAITVLVAYLDRVNVAIALPFMAKDFGWSLAQTGERGGQIIGAFFFAYGLANIMLSGAAERFGPKRSLLLAIASFCVVTALTGYLALGAFSLVSLRLVLGVGEGIHFPMMSALIVRWFPEAERSRANSVYYAGVLIANMLAPLVALTLIEQVGWRAMFLVLGAGGAALTLPLVAAKVHDHPDRHDVTFAATPRERALVGPAARFITLDFAGWTLAGVLNGFFAFGISSWQPTYFESVFALRLGEQKVALSIIYLCGTAGMLFAAWLGDKLNQRIALALVGYAVAAASMFLCASAATAGQAVALFGAGTVAVSFFMAHQFAITQRLLPANKVASGTGLYNGVSLLVGASLGPVVLGQTVAATGTFSTGLYVMAAVAALNTALLAVLWRRLRY